jgi:hypothetical protein
MSLPAHRHPDRHKRMAEDAFGESEAGYGRQPNPVRGDSSASEINQRLMAHMLGLEAPGADPLASYYLLHPFDTGQPQSYPLNAGFTNAINPVMSGDETGSVGGSWSQNMAALDNYGINNANYAYDFGGYGV